MARPRKWTCQRITNGVRCRQVNPKIKQKCQRCGKRRPATAKPAHMAALELDYAAFVAINGGDHCGICGRARPTDRRLDRDHDHETGKPRGLLCHRCNRTLARWITVAWLHAAITYLANSQGDTDAS